MNGETERRLDHLGSALSRLEEALSEPETNRLAVDGTIQRLEFVIELFWKTLKSFLALEGIDVTTPKEALQQAYQARWLNDESAWLQMLKDRNETSHIYDDKQARRIYVHIQGHFLELRTAYNFLSEKFRRLK